VSGTRTDYSLANPSARAVELQDRMLVFMHEHVLPDLLPVAPHLDYRIPSYDMDAFLIEAELLLDWFLPRLKAAVSDDERTSFRTLWRELLQPAIDATPTWVLRDFHSPNLLWLPKRSPHLNPMDHLWRHGKEVM